MDLTGKTFTLLDHTADLGMAVTGTDLRDLFEKAALSMMEIMIRTGPEKGTPLGLSVNGADYADLMVRWLGEVLYLFQGEGRVVIRVQVSSVTQTRVDATLETVPFDPDKHELLAEIKAVTYHDVQVVRKGGRWRTTIIFDL